MATVTKLDWSQGTGGTALTLTPSAQINVDDFIVVMTAQRDHPLTGVADNSSQAGAANTYTLDASLTIATGFVYIHSCRVTRAILTSDTITATLTGGGGAWALGLFLLSPITASSPFDKTAGDRDITAGANWSTPTSAALAQADEICMGIYERVTQSANGTDGGTGPDSPWVEEYFIQQGSSDFVMASRIVTATTGIPYSGVSNGTGGESMCLFATYKIAAAGAPMAFRRGGRGAGW